MKFLMRRESTIEGLSKDRAYMKSGDEDTPRDATENLLNLAVREIEDVKAFEALLCHEKHLTKSLSSIERDLRQKSQGKAKSEELGKKVDYQVCSDFRLTFSDFLTFY